VNKPAAAKAARIDARFMLVISFFGSMKLGSRRASEPFQNRSFLTLLADSE